MVISPSTTETSDFENLVGNTKYHSCDTGPTLWTDRGGSTGWQCDRTSGDDKATNNGTLTPKMSSSPLTRSRITMRWSLKASADGDKKSVNLYLTEKDRFSGVYQGIPALDRRGR